MAKKLPEHLVVTPKEIDKYVFKSSKKYDDAEDVCEAAAYFLEVRRNQWTGNIHIETSVVGGLSAAFNEIRQHLTGDNQYLTADDKTMKKVIKDNYKLVKLYKLVNN